MSRLNWDKVRQRDTEQDRPTEKPLPGPWTHVPRAPVKRWADMTEAERLAIQQAVKPPKR